MGADGRYSFGGDEQAVNETVVGTRTNSYALHGNATITPVPWLELRYDVNYGWSRSRYSEKSNTTTSLSHSGAVHVFPIANLDLSLDYDHVRLELDNLLNQRHYAYTLFNGINTYTYAYTLCGRTVVLRATFKL